MPRKKRAGDMKKEAQAVESTPRAETSDGDPPELLRAMRAMEIDPWEVMSYRLYPDRVVVIQGPAGWKRVWMLDEGRRPERRDSSPD